MEQIIAAAELSGADTVLEIGPGLGALTEKLAMAAGEVVAVEKDHRLYSALRKILRRHKNVKLICADILKLTTDNLPLTAYKLVANIPYYLTGILLKKFLAETGWSNDSPQPPLSLRGGVENQKSPPVSVSGGVKNKVPPLSQGGRDGELFRKPSLIVLLVQKEVAERLVAQAGEMSLLSLSAQFYSKPEIIANVPRENFYPIPDVDSSIVRLRILPEPRFALDEKRFFQFLKIAFASKRKQLQNNLRSFDRTKDYKEILKDIDLNSLARAQDLTLEEWIRLYNKLKV